MDSATTVEPGTMLGMALPVSLKVFALYEVARVTAKGVYFVNQYGFTPKLWRWSRQADGLVYLWDNKGREVIFIIQPKEAK